MEHIIYFFVGWVLLIGFIATVALSLAIVLVIAMISDIKWISDITDKKLFKTIWEVGSTAFLIVFYIALGSISAYAIGSEVVKAWIG